jgi:hypothetical protein
MPTYLYEDGTMIRFARSPGGRPPGGRANGSKTKHFVLTSKHKRLIRSAAIRLFIKKHYGILFCTLTFTKDIEEKAANQCFSNFIDNLKTNFKLIDYVAVKELTQKGRPHYHCLLDIPFTDYKKLNKAWIATFSALMPGSRNAFTTGRQPIIRDVHTVARYITKYITKVERSNEQTKPLTRQYFISRGTACRPALIPEWLREFLVKTKRPEEKEFDYFTWYRLRDWAELPEKYLEKVDPPPDEKQKKHRSKPKKDRIQDPELIKNMGKKVDRHYNL